MTRPYSPEEAAAAERDEAIGRICPTTGPDARDHSQDPP